MMDDRVLIAKEGMVYTDGIVFIKTVWLGVTDSPDNWHQISDAEAEERQRETEEPEWL